MICTECGKPGAEPLTLAEPGFRVIGDPMALCADCLAECEVTEQDEFAEALVQFVMEKLGAYPVVRPDPKTVEAFVMAMASRVGRIIGTLHADSPEAAGNMLEEASAHMFEQAAMASKYFPFKGDSLQPEDPA